MLLGDNCTAPPLGSPGGIRPPWPYPAHRTGTALGHCRLPGTCSLPELPQGPPHPRTRKGEGLRVLQQRYTHLMAALCRVDSAGLCPMCSWQEREKELLLLWLLTALEELSKCSSLC